MYNCTWAVSGQPLRKCCSIISLDLIGTVAHFGGILELWRNPGILEWKITFCLGCSKEPWILLRWAKRLVCLTHFSSWIKLWGRVAAWRRQWRWTVSYDTEDRKFEEIWCFPKRVKSRHYIGFFEIALGIWLFAAPCMVAGTSGYDFYSSSNSEFGSHPWSVDGACGPLMLSHLSLVLTWFFSLSFTWAQLHRLSTFLAAITSEILLLANGLCLEQCVRVEGCAPC